MENLRTSSYLIDVKLDDTDKYMFIHGYTGAIDIVNEKVAHALKSNPESFSLKDCPLSDETVAALEKRGYLTHKAQEEEYAYVARMADALHRKELLMGKHYVWVVTYDCNFRCPYCFEHELSETEQPWSNEVFSHSMVDHVYANIAKMELEYSNNMPRNKTMVLYGGEPLLALNKKIVEHIVKKGCELGFKFEAITNGYDLDSYKDILCPEQISALQITIDGNKSCHDLRRVHYLYGSSFDKIVKNINMVLQQNVRVVVRINTDRIIFDQLEELYNKFNELHFFDYKNFSIESALLRDHKVGSSAKQSNVEFMTMHEYLSKHKQARYKYGCQFQHLYKNILNVIGGKERLRFRSTYCNAQCNGYIFDPCGSVYPCWNVVGNPKYIIGHYNQSSLVLNSTSELWRNHNIRYSNKCKHCKYALLCGGGCLARVAFSEDGFMDSDCNSFPIILKTAVNRAFDEYQAHIV